MTTLKADLTDKQWRKWQIIKAELGDGKIITNGIAINRLVDHYNQSKGRRIV